MRALVFELWFGEFLILSVGNDARPIGLASNLIGLDADLGVRAHPFDLLSQGGEDVDIVLFINDAYRDYVGLIIERAAQTCHGGARQNLAAFGFREFIDSHSSYPFPFPS